MEAQHATPASTSPARMVLDPATELAALAQRLTDLVRVIAPGGDLRTVNAAQAADDIALAAGVCLAAVALVPDSSQRNLVERASCTR